MYEVQFGTHDGSFEATLPRTREQILEYLQSDPGNAVKYDSVAVMRDAGERRYYGTFWPQTEPDDVIWPEVKVESLDDIDDLMIAIEENL